MSKILMTVWPIETHLSPFMAVAQCLTARGHEVAFYTSGQLRNQLEREGFRCFPFERVTSHHAECNPGAVITSKMGVRARRQMWHDFLLGSVPGQLQDLERISTGCGGVRHHHVGTHPGRARDKTSTASGPRAYRVLPAGGTRASCAGHFLAPSAHAGGTAGSPPAYRGN